MARPSVRVSIDCGAEREGVDDERLREALSTLAKAAMDAADEVLRVAGEGDDGILLVLTAETFELEPATDEESAIVDEAIRRHG